MAAAVEAAGIPSAAAPLPVDSSEQFVNTGLLTWLERRKQWTHRTNGADKQRIGRKRPLPATVTPAQVLSLKPFPKPVPLRDVIEVLTEVWEEEDFYS